MHKDLFVENNLGAYQLLILPDVIKISNEEDDESFLESVLKDALNDSPISGATINVYTDSKYSEPFVFKPSLTTESNGSVSVSTNLLSIGDTLYFQVSVTGYESYKTPVIGVGYHRVENEDSIVRLSPKGAVSRLYVFNIKVWDSLKNPVSGVRLRLYEDFSLSTLYSKVSVSTKSEDGRYEITERIKDIIFSTVDLDVSILNDGYKLTDVGIDSLSAVEIIT